MIASFLLLLTCGSLFNVYADEHNHRHYTNEFAVEIEGGSVVADVVARELGYKNQGQIGSLDNHYLFVHSDAPARSKRSTPHLHKRLSDDPRVAWVEQQVARVRVKREFLRSTEDIKRYKEASRYDDPMFKKQWYLYDTRKGDLRQPKLDLHQLKVWAQGYTGKGVVVTVLDDGLERNHPDLEGNYDPDASYDLNNDDPDPMPRYDPTNENKHGTRCAGEVSMIANNHICGVGVAYNSRIGGVKLLDGSVTDRIEAAAISFNHTYVDIYSASWGPNDDGKTVEGPGRLASKAFLKGIYEGRGGLGVIYVWASGNGGRNHDDCDCDGYTSSIFTLSISSSTYSANVPWYAEKCASTMATAFSSGNYGEPEITTTDLHGKCTTKHTGTSAAAPLAAGVFALVLEANPHITWRDLQHLVTFTSQPEPFTQQSTVGWKTNGAGFKVNSAFGFGLLDAGSLVENALKWKRVPEKVNCTVPSARTDEESLFPLTFEEMEVINIKTSGCKNKFNEINFLEHVQVRVTIECKRRGDVAVDLISPSGTTTTLLNARSNDKSTAGFNKWVFMSVHTWGENPRGLDGKELGKWQVIIKNQSRNKWEKITVKSVELILHGTKDQPAHLAAVGGKRVYNEDYNSVKNDRALARKKALDKEAMEKKVEELFSGFL